MKIVGASVNFVLYVFRNRKSEDTIHLFNIYLQNFVAPTLIRAHESMLLKFYYLLRVHLKLCRVKFDDDGLDSSRDVLDFRMAMLLLP